LNNFEKKNRYDLAVPDNKNFEKDKDAFNIMRLTLEINTHFIKQMKNEIQGQHEPTVSGVD